MNNYTFIWPTNTRRITSRFGIRTHPVTGEKGSMHWGIDIAEGGARPIYAAAEGRVTRSEDSSGGFGVVIYLEHIINGEIWNTVYAHMRAGSRRVRVGENVKQGQEIGIMGATGNVTGQHLHFELHRGAWNINRPGGVDPVEYLEKDLTTVGIYTIKAGDTFWGLAQASNGAFTVADLEQWNPGVDPRKLQVGQRINVGEPKPSVQYTRPLRWVPGQPTMTGDDVKAVQRVVGVKVDGRYGPATAAAVRAYQQRHGLIVDGIAGPQTFAHMFG